MNKETENKEKKPKTKRWWFLTIILVVFLGVAGVTYATGLVLKTEKTDNLRCSTLESFTVNLAEPGYRQYLRTTITLEYGSSAVEKEIKNKEHQVRNAVIELLTSKKVGELKDKKNLRYELKNKINEVLQHKIESVYFDEFITQL